MSLEETLGDLLRNQEKTIAVAESITGGLISDLITNVPGSSQYFLASIVSYSNESKVQLLGVRKETLQDFGAVSEETALEMAEGVRNRIGSDIGASVTGIAGPSGATEVKPVGLVYFCVSDGRKLSREREVFKGDRMEVKKQAAEHLLRKMIVFLR